MLVTRLILLYRQELMDRMQNIMNKSMEYRNSFDNYAYLWVDDRNEFMRQFLLYNHVLTTEEIEAHAEDGVPECPPTLNQFKEQVCKSHGSLYKIHVCLGIHVHLIRSVYTPGEDAFAILRELYEGIKLCLPRVIHG